MKGRALRRALATVDVVRVGTTLPVIVDTTEVVTPAIAQAMLQHNTRNRPINWAKVELYAAAMRRGEWRLHAQGIIFDTDGNLLTGQKRLWAVVYSGCNVPFRISRGNPPASAHLIDRGDPQSSRDLAARDTGRRHSPTEASLARAMCALRGDVRPSVDALAAMLHEQAEVLASMLAAIRGTKKTKEVLMIVAAIGLCGGSPAALRQVDGLAVLLVRALAPATVAQCWNRGAAFGLAMEHARRLVTSP